MIIFAHIIITIIKMKQIKLLLGLSFCLLSVAVQAQEHPDSSDVEEFTVKGVSFLMVAVEGGTFKMGATSEQTSDASEEEKPVHEVTLSTFYIAETEVTQELWQAVMGYNPSHFKGKLRPVENVSWDDCQDFLHELSALTGRHFRLPTEAEWEYAARGGNMSTNHKYSGGNSIYNIGWCNSNSVSQTRIVGTKRPNGLGIYDMSGNVWEWCQDWYGAYRSESQTDPTGPSTGYYRVRRGGGWGGSSRVCRVSARYSSSPSSASSFLGLRLAL